MNDQLKRLSTALYFLASIGGPDDIADFLRRQGIVGRQHDTACCPVARYLARDLGTPIWVDPFLPDAPMNARGIAGIGDPWDDDSAGVTLPAAVNAFAAGFDRSKYPALIEGGTTDGRTFPR